MNFKRKLLLIIASFLLIVPSNVLAYTKYLIPGGENIGINIKTNGVYVVGFYEVDGKNIARDQGIKIGDKIVSINDQEIMDIASLSEKINSQDNVINIKLGLIRNDELKYLNLKLKKDETGIYKTGMYVKDAITGIGTITYITLDNMYGALGHEIIESTTNERFEVASGEIYNSRITGITKSTKGKTGEKNAKIFYNNVEGTITKNLETGIFGKYQVKINKDDAVLAASLDEVELGKAEIITVLDDDKKETFTVEILSIDNTSDTKNFRIKLTDEKLIAKTGGIIKGMSGSPILQNGKIIGAVTHALVDKPTEGYGISVMKMLESME